MTDLDLLPGAAEAATFTEPTGTPPAALAGYRPADLPDLPAAEYDLRQRILRAITFGLARPAPGREEREHRINQATIRDATFGAPQHLVVANPKGGSGKTPAALLIGGFIAMHRGSTVIWDAADAAGTLGARALGTQVRSVDDVARNPQQYLTTAALGAAAATQTSHADVIASLGARAFDGTHIAAVTAVLDLTYRVQVADTGNVEHSGAFQAAVATADLIVVPTTLTADSVNGAVGLLRCLQDQPRLLARTVVLINDHGIPVPLGTARRIFTTAGVAGVVTVPFDPHIAAGVGLDPHRLTRASTHAWTAAAAVVIRALTPKDTP